MKKINYKAIINGCNRGDRNHQRIFYERFYSKLAGTATLYYGENGLDSVQDVFLKVFNKEVKYKGKYDFDSIFGWLKDILIGDVIKDYKDSKTTNNNL